MKSNFYPLFPLLFSLFPSRRENLSPPSTSQRLYGSPLRHDPSYTKCRQTCRRENISVYTKLAQANPRSVGPDYCSGISSMSCLMVRPTAIHQEGRRQSTISFGGRGAEVGSKRGCTAGTVVPSTPSQSSVCCPQKQGRLEANYRPKTTELLPGASSFQNGGFVHANRGPEARMANGKIDLKDAYLTIPLAREHHCLLSFQVQQGEWIQFHCLPLGAGQTIPVSTFQSHRESLNQDSNRSDRVCLSHSSSLASTGLVPTVAEVTGENSNPSSCETRSTPESRSGSTSSTSGGTNVHSHMAYLWQGFTVQGFSARVTNILLQS